MLKFAYGVAGAIIAAVIAGIILSAFFTKPTDVAAEREKRGDLFYACLKDPAADAAKHGHGGNCCTHLKPQDAQLLGGAAAKCVAGG